MNHRACTQRTLVLENRELAEIFIFARITRYGSLTTIPSADESSCCAIGSLLAIPRMFADYARENLLYGKKDLAQPITYRVAAR